MIYVYLDYSDGRYSMKLLTQAERDMYDGFGAETSAVSDEEWAAYEAFLEVDRQQQRKISDLSSAWWEANNNKQLYKKRFE
jgi:hypothetical protein